MAFNPADIGISNTTGDYPSETNFSLTGNVISVSTNGDPYPGNAGKPLVNDGQTPRTGFGSGFTIDNEKTINLSFTYRGGQNSLNPQDVIAGAVGITATGSYIYSTKYFANEYPRSREVAPPGFTWNIQNFRSELGFDEAGGRPLQTGEYYYIDGRFLPSAWVNEFKVYNSNSYYADTSFGNDHFRHSNGHSKILGFTFDGYPIYGPWARRSPLDPNSPIVQMKSSYKLRDDDSHRPKGSKFTDTINVLGEQVVLKNGLFCEDYQYAEGIGNLDEYNGRFCYTPEFPTGTYAYFLTYEDDDLEKPAFPFVVGLQTKQNRTAGVGAPLAQLEDLWNLRSGAELTTLIERSTTELQLPVANGIEPRIELISGRLPGGLRIEGTKLVGTPFEVQTDIVNEFVLRAYYNGQFEDRTFKIIVTGPDDPEWLTPEDLLPVGPNKLYFILDNALIDFQLQAIDPDLPAGDELEYYIADGDGELPPGVELTPDGRLVGIVDPLLALDKRAGPGGYDTNVYGNFLFDYGTRSDNGYGSFFYDTEDYDYSVPSFSPKKLNRYYQFAVTVTDGDNSDRRIFRIFLVGDDFLRSDNTIMQAATGLFTADNTYLRTPVWLTPNNLGVKRANNYVTLYLDVIQNDTLAGAVFYTLEPFNDDGTPSELPPGLALDSQTGEITGTIPYQPAVTAQYKFSVRATRFSGDLDTATIFAQFYEDTLLGVDNFKIIKLNRSLEDGVDDLNELLFRTININGRNYKIENVDGSPEEYDIIFVNDTIGPNISISLAKTGRVNDDFLFVRKLTESEKTKLQNRLIRFSDTESYQIQGIVPYLEARIENLNGTRNTINRDLLELAAGNQYIVNDYAVFNGQYYQLSIGDAIGSPVTINSFDNGFLVIPGHGITSDQNGDVYRWNTIGLDPSGVQSGSFYYIRVQTDSLISLHPSKNDALFGTNTINVGGGTGVHQIDRTGSSHIVTASNGVINFSSEQWTFISPDTETLTNDQTLDVAVNYLSKRYTQGPALVRHQVDYSLWFIEIPSTADTRLLQQVRSIFTDEENTKVEIVADNRDRLQLNTPLIRSLNQGRNIGIALFRGDAFRRDVTVANEDEETDIVESIKTFTLNVIGEIESEIEWLTESDLGTLRANYISTLKVEARTTLTDSLLLYRIKEGRLPFGMFLNYDGQIIGQARQYPNDDGPGLTTFDNKSTTFDGTRIDDRTSFDREYRFTVIAEDRYKITAIEREFVIKIEDEDRKVYSNIYMRPLLKEEQRVFYTSFVSNPDTFTPSYIYRPNDPAFGIQTQLQMLVYAGIETKSITEFVSASAKNHKRKKYKLGEVKTAVAKNPGTNEVLYEVVYIEVLDPAESSKGSVRKDFLIKTTEKITADSLQYDTKDDVTNTGTGTAELPIYGREAVKFIIPNGNDLVIGSRDGVAIEIDADNLDFEIELRDGSNIEIELKITDSEPYRIRPKTNTIKADSDAIKVSQNKDNKRYISNVSNMRDNIKAVGETERVYLPLWMRTPQDETFPQELDYKAAIPICYCKPGTSNEILLNIQNTGFDVSSIEFDIDRYIIDRTAELNEEQYILFANYQFNV